MRTSALATAILCSAFAANCTFSAHPISGTQACSNDNPPKCPDGYSCVDSKCYDNGHLPVTSDAAGADSSTQPDACTPTVITCNAGPGKRCGKVPDPCTGTTVDCGTCIAGEACGTGHTCSVYCGQVGKPCCVGSTCTEAGAVCSNGSCTACGGANQLCCTTGNACTALDTLCSETSSTTVGTACLLTCAATTGVCASGTDLDCYTLCGPGKIGSKTCTCTANAWKCPACTFPSGADYSCYKLPVPPPACDAATLPTAGANCTATACSACGAAVGKGFIDAAGVERAGFCVCTSSHWNCALTREWPCPGNTGC
jgi:hypothetical protein